MHLGFETALRSTLQLEEEAITVIMLRLTFGGQACPSEWGSASKTICDLTNALLNDPTWNPTLLYNPQSEDLPELVSLPNNIEREKARELAIEVPVSDVGSAEIYLEPIISSDSKEPAS